MVRRAVRLKAREWLGVLKRDCTLVARDEVSVLGREKLARIFYEKCLEHHVKLVEHVPQVGVKLYSDRKVATPLGHKLGDAVDLERQRWLAEVERLVGEVGELYRACAFEVNETGSITLLWWGELNDLGPVSRARDW